MVVAEAIRRMCDESAKGPIQVSQELGKSRAYVSATISRGNIPRVNTLVQIAQACGYLLILESETDRIVIAPTKE